MNSPDLKFRLAFSRSNLRSALQTCREVRARAKVDRRWEASEAACVAWIRAWLWQVRDAQYEIRREKRKEVAK